MVTVAAATCLFGRVHRGEQTLTEAVARMTQPAGRLICDRRARPGSADASCRPGSISCLRTGGRGRSGDVVDVAGSLCHDGMAGRGLIGSDLSIVSKTAADADSAARLTLLIVGREACATMRDLDRLILRQRAQPSCARRWQVDDRARCAITSRPDIGPRARSRSARNWHNADSTRRPSRCAYLGSRCGSASRHTHFAPVPPATLRRIAAPCLAERRVVPHHGTRSARRRAGDLVVLSVARCAGAKILAPVVRHGPGSS